MLATFPPLPSRFNESKFYTKSATYTEIIELTIFSKKEKNSL